MSITEYQRTWSRTTPGCVLTGSNYTTAEADMLIAGWAVDAGWTPDPPITVELLDVTDDAWELLHWLGEEAIEYLNTLVPAGTYLHWYEGDLFLTEDVDH